MPILAAFMVPHPPMIVPAVGQGSEEQIAETTRAYERVADEVAALAPDTIIITSPHSVMYADYFHISPGGAAAGSFRRFRAPEVRFSECCDTALVQRICELAEASKLPAGTLGERDSELDHGTMVPLWFIRQKYGGGKLVRTGLSGLPLTEHYRLGQLLALAVEDTGRRAVLIASGDLSHKLQEYGPYGFAPEGPEYDRRIMDVCGRAAFGELFDFDDNFCEKAAECGHRSFVILAGALDGLRVRAEVLSHQDVTGVGYGICTFYPEGEDENRRFLQAFMEKTERECREKAEKSDAYVKLARASVEAWVRRRERLAVPEGLPEELLTRRAGTFVTLHKHGKLRGCIGTILATQESVAEEILQNAVSACSRDPRFPPVTEDELNALEISVDVLGELEPIDSPEELDVKRYGVVVSHGRKRGLLLPNLDGVDTVEDQIRIARQKGGIRASEPYRLERFEVVRHF
ncbi:MAG: AmmeMemoRadiSam system protein A [Oscillospiraceae bacterium]|nr:AmmeMemoRadiSam system protein A [Oscillospiraceae bacterium]